MAVDRTRREGYFPNRLAVERDLAGIPTQKELAEQAHIDPSWYSRIESGRILPTKPELDAICGALGVQDPERLFDRVYLEAIGAAERARRTSPAAAVGQ